MAPSAQAEIRDRNADAIYKAISALKIEDDPVAAIWPALDQLSSETFFEGVEAVPGGIIIQQDRSFEAAATAFVTLRYGESDSEAMSDSFPASIKGHVETEGYVVVDRVEVDTSSFYES